MTTTGTRKSCTYTGPDGYACGILIELRQGPNPALPPGWYEVANDHPHTCRRPCPTCHRPIGGPDHHAPDCTRR